MREPGALFLLSQSLTSLTYLPPIGISHRVFFSQVHALFAYFFPSTSRPFHLLYRDTSCRFASPLKTIYIFIVFSATHPPFIPLPLEQSGFSHARSYRPDRVQVV